MPRPVRQAGQQRERLGELLLRGEPADAEHDRHAGLQPQRGAQPDCAAGAPHGVGGSGIRRRRVGPAGDGRGGDVGLACGALGLARGSVVAGRGVEVSQVDTGRHDRDGPRHAVAAQQRLDLGRRRQHVIGAAQRPPRQARAHGPAEAPMRAEVVRVVLVQRVVCVHVRRPEPRGEPARPQEGDELRLGVQDLRRPPHQVRQQVAIDGAPEPRVRIHRAGRQRRQPIDLAVEGHRVGVGEGEQPYVVAGGDQPAPQRVDRGDDPVDGGSVAVAEQQHPAGHRVATRAARAIEPPCVGADRRGRRLRVSVDHHGVVGDAHRPT